MFATLVATILSTWDSLYSRFSRPRPSIFLNRDCLDSQLPTLRHLTLKALDSIHFRVEPLTLSTLDLRYPRPTRPWTLKARLESLGALNLKSRTLNTRAESVESLTLESNPRHSRRMLDSWVEPQSLVPSTLWSWTLDSQASNPRVSSAQIPTRVSKPRLSILELSGLESSIDPRVYPHMAVVTTRCLVSDSP